MVNNVGLEKGASEIFENTTE